MLPQHTSSSPLGRVGVGLIKMFQHNFDIVSWPIWIALGIFCGSFFIQLFYYLYFYLSALLLKRKASKGNIHFQTAQPPVSIIICAKNESKNLSDFLPSILTQDYPNYEVIVVNDGSTDESEIVLANFERTYKHLYHTYIPENVKVMSPKKLALTVGIKAAKYDYLLFTDADCQTVSDKWIANMMRNFTPKTDFVLGYGAYEQKPGFLSHLVSYDTFFILLQYTGFAYRGKPYMGVGRNMAYRKQLFFDRKGFASILHLQSGDDDLFINKAATKTNTAIEIDPDSTTISTLSENFKNWFIQKERHLSTASHYKNQSKKLIGIEVLSRGLFYSSFVALLCTLQPTLLIIAGSLLLTRYILQLVIINLSAKHFNERPFYFSILLFDILLPLISLFILSFNRITRKTKYKWK